MVSKNLIKRKIDISEVLLVKTKIGPSKIHGIGLFADQFIPKGTLIWKFTPNFDQKISVKKINNFPKELQDYLETYTWPSKEPGKYCLVFDEAKFFNHSKFPNTISIPYENEEEIITLASRDIPPGEEITGNYKEYDDNFIDKWS